MLSLQHSPGLDLAQLIQSMNDDLVSIERTVMTLRQRLDQFAAARQTAPVVAEALTLAGTAVPEIACGDAPIDTCASLELVLVDQPVIVDALGSGQADVTPADVVEGLAAEVVASKEPNDVVTTNEIVAIVTVAMTSATAVEVAAVDVTNVETRECDPVRELNSVSMVPSAANTAVAAVAVECVALPAGLATADAITTPANSEIADASAHIIAIEQAASASVETSAVGLKPAIMRDARTANKGATSRGTLGLLAAASAAIILLGLAALTWPEVQFLVAQF